MPREKAYERVPIPVDYYQSLFPFRDSTASAVRERLLKSLPTGVRQFSPVRTYIPYCSRPVSNNLNSYWASSMKGIKQSLNRNTMQFSYVVIPSASEPSMNFNN